jgi:hypothetical protein
MRLGCLICVVAVAWPGPALADEGFWTIDRFPRQKVKERYGVEVDEKVLQRVAGATVLFRTGAAAFVSPKGLLLVKAGTVKPCLEALRQARRTSARFARWCDYQALRKGLPLFDRLYCRPLDRAADLDYVERGYLAQSLEEERRCPGASISRLIAVSDVTRQVDQALATVPSGQRVTSERNVLRRLEAECGERGNDRCDVISLHGGSRYLRYTVRRYEDVRVVFVPERRAADFGDLEDNMTFPDHDFKASFLRVYDNDRPLDTPEHLRLSTARPREGELTLMVGFALHSLRYAPALLLAFQRDQESSHIPVYAEYRGLLYALSAVRPELTAHVDFDAINATTVGLRPHLLSLSPELIAARAADEQRLLAELARQNSALVPELKNNLVDLQAALASYGSRQERFLAMSEAWGAVSKLMRLAITAVTLAEPRAAAAARAALLAPYDDLQTDLEIATLELALRILQDRLPANDPVLRQALASQSARQRAKALVRGTRLTSAAFRRQLVDGGAAALQATRDPLLDLARQVVDEVKASQATIDRVNRASARYTQLLERARYTLRGDDMYPEGTGTLRVSFGTLKGYQDDGRVIAPITTLGDLFNNARDDGPHQLTARWRAARPRLDPSTPLNLATTHEGMGFAAVLVDTRGDVLGIQFNGNRHFAGVDVSYDETRRRVVSVPAVAIVEVLRGVYQASRLLAELGQ